MNNFGKVNNGFLIIYNLDNKPMVELDDIVSKVHFGEQAEIECNFHNKEAAIGDRVFLMKLGTSPKGIFASGHIVSESYSKPHFDSVKDSKNEKQIKTKIALDWILNPQKDDLLSQDTLNDHFPNQIWSSRQSGDIIDKNILYDLEVLWGKHIGIEKDIKNVLKVANDIEPSTHDASYVLMDKLVKKYAELPSFDTLNFCDIDCFLNICTILKPKTKRLGIEKCNLPQIAKDEILKLFDDCVVKYNKGEYSNKEAFGMFGSGFKTFNKGNSDVSNVENIIKLFVSIQKVTTPYEAYDILSKSCFGSWKGIGVATLSVMLHCLKPEWFPIMNRNQGYKDIYQFLILNRKREDNIVNYIDWCKSLYELKQKEFNFKNFRVIDLIQNLLGKEEKNMSSKVYVVFQKPEQFQKESKEGYIQAPAKSDNGKPIKWHWKTLLEIKKGDIVFHLSNQKIVAVSYVTKEHDTISIDSHDYNRVLCEYTVLKNKIDIYKYTSELSDACKNAPRSPFNKHGKGKLAYLTILPASLYNLFATEILKNNAQQESDLDYIKSIKSAKDSSNIDETKISLGLNTILFGPPGTGKTYNTKKYAVAICEGKNPFEYNDYSEIKTKYENLVNSNRVTFTTFHQSYGYEDFIEGIKPESDLTGNIKYSIKPGIFKEFCHRAKENKGNNYVFVVDEINRGNISKIFGELITLIEESKRGGAKEEMSAILPYSGERFSVPNNVYILGTMNTADRSIAMIDTALRRRFNFIEMMPDADVLITIGANKVQTLDVATMLETINRRIEVLFDREHTIGHAFFTKLKDNPTLDTLASIFENNIIPLLQEYFYEDYEKIVLVLGDNAKTSDDYKFIKTETVEPTNIFKNSKDFDNSIVSEKKYAINKEALKHIESYIEIYQ